MRPAISPRPLVPLCTRTRSECGAEVSAGLGSLIAAAVIKDVVPRNITTVLLHQCPAIEHWPLAAAIWKMVRAAALEQQLFTASTRVLTLSPVDRNVSFASVPGRFLCARELFVQKQAGYWLECRQPILTLWRAHLDGWLAAHRLAADKRPTRAVVWQRPEVQEGGASAYWAPRRIVNIDRVIQLFEPPAVVVSASEKMSAVQQVALFRSFGVVISIHGSHLTGLLFAPPHIVAVEVQSVLSDLTFFKNGQCLVRRYVLSVGHTPQHPLTCDISRSRNVIEFERSKEGARSMRCRLKHKNANLVVNATILRRDLGLSCSMCRYRTGAA